jgi:DNA-binding transcriptional MerR regulator
MEYRVEELGQAAGVRVDTIRFYQSRGLIPPPRREGRVAFYEEAHLARLRRIRELLEQGFKLAQIGRVLEAEGDLSRAGARSEPLLRALVAERMGERSLGRAELAAESGLPEALLAAAEQAGLMEPARIAGDERYTTADLEMARAALTLLAAGLPLAELLQVASRHADNVRELADAGIDLFDDYIRKSGPAAADEPAITDAFRRLLPEVTRLVALHFQRTLLNRALDRLRAQGESEALERAIAVAGSGRLDVQWR